MTMQSQMDTVIMRTPQQAERETQKMEVLSKLVGGVTHDFNNLLTVILGYTEILMGRHAASDPDRELLHEIHRAGERAESLTRQLQAFTRKKVVSPRLLDLNSVVSDTEKMLRRLIGEDILMTTIFAPSLAPIKADPGDIEQVILHLAVHARDAMPRGGRFTVETDNIIFDDTDNDVPFGRFVMLSITDTGATNYTINTNGAAPRDTDFGLTLVRNIVRQYGGFLQQTNEPEGGTAFKVYFPQANPPAAPGSLSGLRFIPRGSETVLLVEDEDSVRALARHVLQTCGYTVIEASNGAAALDLAESYGGPIHLLLTDVVMPRLDGRELANRLHLVKPHLRVLFLSGYTEQAMERYGLPNAEHAFLQKPFTSSALAMTVRSVLDAAAHV